MIRLAIIAALMFTGACATRNNYTPQQNYQNVTYYKHDPTPEELESVTLIWSGNRIIFMPFEGIVTIESIK